MVPLLVIGCLVGLALLLNFWQLQQIRKLKNEVRILKKQPATANVRQHESVEEKPRASFSVSLTDAEKKATEPSGNTISQADKYRYVASLAEQGLEADGIAAALQMSAVEVEQLLQLARLRQRPAS